MFIDYIETCLCCVYHQNGFVGVFGPGACRTYPGHTYWCSVPASEIGAGSAGRYSNRYAIQAGRYATQAGRYAIQAGRYHRECTL